MNIEESENLAKRRLTDVPSYLIEVRDLLRESQPEVWEWFRSVQQTQAAREAVSLDLLKSTVRLEPDGNAELYRLAQSAIESLDLDVPITFYQAKQSGRTAGHFNASISCDPNQAHLVMQGDLQEHLDTAELSAVFGHELSHLLLWNLQDGEFLHTWNMLIALSNDAAQQPIYSETLRLFSQYSEIFCDRGAAVVAGSYAPVVSSLIKIVTGVKSVKVKDYLRQANEIFSKDDRQGSQEVTHPQLYIRARALDLWQKNAKDTESSIEAMVQGNLSLDRMDYCRQGIARDLTREVLDAALEPTWMRCEATLAHARLYFEDYEPGDWKPGRLVKQLSNADKDFLDYVGYVMLDVVTADRDLLEPALAHTIGLAETFGIKDAYLESVRKELRLRKKQLEQIEKSADELAKNAAEIQQQAQQNKQRGESVEDKAVEEKTDDNASMSAEDEA